MSAFGNLAKQGTTVLLPSNTNDVSSMVTQASTAAFCANARANDALLLLGTRTHSFWLLSHHHHHFDNDNDALLLCQRHPSAPRHPSARNGGVRILCLLP